MFKISQLFSIIALTICLTAGASSAATLTIDVGGQLTGATGVNVNGTLYDVEFRDGTCFAIFDGCDDESDFTFTTITDALVASQALLDQVFVDSGLGDFDSDPSLTLGIESQFGFIHSPYGAANLSGTVPTTYALNRADALPDVTDSELRGLLEGTGAISTYAVFTATPALPTVPLPAGFALLLSSVGGIAALRRFKKLTA